MAEKFTYPSREKLDALVTLSQSIERGKAIPFEINHELHALLGVPLNDYSTTMDGALKLRDIIFAGHDYVNLDMREYDDSRGLVFLMKIENNYGEAEGDHHTRSGALLDALLSHVVFEVETAEND